MMTWETWSRLYTQMTNIGKGHILEQPSPKYPAGHSTINDEGQKTNVTYSEM